MLSRILSVSQATIYAGISLFALSFSAHSAMQYEQQPVGYYGYPVPVAYPQAPRYRPAYRVYHPQQFQQRRVYPFNYPYPAAPTYRAPETINDKVKGTVTSITKPATVIKTKTIDTSLPDKPAPKKVVPSSKLVFLEKVAPMVRRANEDVMLEREKLVTIIDYMDRGYDLNSEQSDWVKSRMKKYRVKGKAEVANLRESLLPKIDIIPVELALAQAANESAWGKSRFAREARNLFGVWTYDESKGIVPKKRAKGAKHLVRKYESMEASIRHYITLLNSHPAYKSLRDIRLTQREKGEQLDGSAMAAGLIKYSAKGEKYVAIIRSMISSNNLTDFRAA